MEISVIIPVYNAKQYLAKAIESVLIQRGVEWELWLIDDGSTDESLNMCNEYANRYSQIHVIHKENEGPGIARNVGIAHATGEYIFFLDSDDWIVEGALSYLYHLAIERSADIVCYGIGKTTDRNADYSLKLSDRVYEYEGEAILRRYFSKMTASICKLFHKSIFEKYQFEKVKLCEDAWSMHLFFSQANKLIVTHTQCYIQFFHPDSRSREEFSEKELISEKCGMRMVTFASENCPGVYDAALYNLIRRQLRLLYQIVEKKKYYQYKELYYEIVQRLRLEKHDAIKYKANNSDTWKLMNLVTTCPYIYRNRDRAKALWSKWNKK